MASKSSPLRVEASGAAQDEGVRLMLAFQAGEERAFDRLVERYSPAIYALLTRFLGPKPNREDLVQEVFLRVLRARERYQPSARFSTFLYRIVFNLAGHERERAALRSAEGAGLRLVREAHGEEVDFELEDPKAAAPHAALERADVVQAVREALDALPPNQRMALILSRYENLPLSQIGLVMSLSESAVKALAHRARESLRERLAPFMEQQDP